MVIINQDRDKNFTLTDKGLKGQIYVRKHYHNNSLMGWNIYGKKLLKEVLLGTYDEGEAQQIVDEIYTLLRSGAKKYVMPESALELSELEAIENV